MDLNLQAILLIAKLAGGERCRIKINQYMPKVKTVSHKICHHLLICSEICHQNAISVPKALKWRQISNFAHRVSFELGGFF